MAVVTITPANVQLGAGSGANTSNTYPVILGATATEMQAVYVDTADDNKRKLAVNSATATAQVEGLLLTPGDDLDQAIVVTSGVKVEFGGTLTAGETYYLSSTAGAVEPGSDLSSGDYITQIGFALTTSVMYVNIVVTGEQLP